MKMTNIKNTAELRRDELRIDCSKCWGLCCVSLYFSASEGFPNDKKAGVPCDYLNENFSCGIHSQLSEKGFLGCCAFDCLGAGQKVSLLTFEGVNWRNSKEIASSMFEAFLIMRQLHELLWYLIEAYGIFEEESVRSDAMDLLNRIYGLTLLKADVLLSLDISPYRAEVNEVLLSASQKARTEVGKAKDNSQKSTKHLKPRADLIGKNLRGYGLSGANLRGALLIASDLRGCDLSGTDLIGADLRDADIRGTNLSKSIFLTQSQINAARGDSHTNLPKFIDRPCHWETMTTANPD